MAIDIKPIVKNFKIDGEFIESAPYGSGHINDTFCAYYQTLQGKVRYIHQRINHNIFKKPEELMENIERVTTHLRGKIEAAGGNPLRETLQIVPALDGKSFYRTDDGNYWRTYLFIEGAKTYDVVPNLDVVYEASKSFGRFQKQIADVPGKRLHETIPNFHDTRSRFKAFQEVLSKDTKNRAASVNAEVDFVLKREQDASRLVDMLERGTIPERITHNDTKLNNVMIDDVTGKGICVIDLDTIMPGLPMYDFGDSVRIGASTAPEDEQDLSKVSFSIDMFERLTHGYLDAAREFLIPAEVGELAFSAKLLTFECGMRFLTDHLNGDVYFKIKRENHNLDRARTQFKMVSVMESQMDKMLAVVAKYGRKEG